MQGYAYILLHPGIPCVFYDHVYSDGLLRPSLWRRLKSLVAKTPRLDGSAFTFLPLDRCIVALIALRKRQGITSHSSVGFTSQHCGCVRLLHVGEGTGTSSSGAVCQ